MLEYMGARGPKPKELIATHWRPELAYAVGLLASDGSLSKDGRHIDFTSADIDQIETFKKCLDLHHIMTGTKTVEEKIQRNIIESSLEAYCFTIGW